LFGERNTSATTIPVTHIQFRRIEKKKDTTIPSGNNFFFLYNNIDDLEFPPHALDILFSKKMHQLGWTTASKTMLLQREKIKLEISCTFPTIFVKKKSFHLSQLLFSKLLNSNKLFDYLLDSNKPCDFSLKNF
jgi:hypothetical protein